ncbi:ferredoxin [Microtetraspora sp. AC03309]|uniref:ferredoxin n=1 Tax=Microtetraspora sp. AC03309 TaxID=2779376 RepID=UPI0027E09F38|nr:ferredoxin [Microtetraspora sp. AC03309]
MMRVDVDRELCRVHAQCVFAAPDVFELDEDDELRYVTEPDGSLLPAVEEAALLCPVQAISFRD